MKAIGMPPSDPRMREMNDAQWLWCYFNQMEDEKDEADSWKARFDYLTYFINFEMAQSVHDSVEQNKTSKYKQDGLHGNSEFDSEIRAASLGYEPSSGLSVQEFLDNYQNKKKNEPADIMNDSFEDLLASGAFVEVSDHEQGIGNKNEHVDDFLERAMALQQDIVENNQYNNVPVDIDESDWEHLTNSKTDQSKTEEDKLQEEIDLDLDFFDVDD